jgi:ankyrin repeat protein
MARKKAQRKQETTLVPPKLPTLSALLHSTRTAASAQAVRTYLAIGGSCNALLPHEYGKQGKQMQLPLLHHMACIGVHPHTELAECVQLLVAAGADINAADSDDRTAVMHAAGKPCCAAVLDAFLRAGADPCVRSSLCGSTALHVAALIGLPASCELLLASADSLLEARDASGWTALTQAAAAGKVANVKVLIRLGANVNTVDDHGTTPLIAATQCKKVDAAVCLLEAGADVNAAAAGGLTALIAAARANSIALVQLLLNHGADVGAVDDRGQNALCMAATEGHVFIMDMLAKRGLSVNTADNSGRTMLMMAAGAGQTAAAEWLLQHGAAVDAVTSDPLTKDFTALFCAGVAVSDAAAAATAALLLANGADVHKCTEDGRLALELVVSQGNMQCARVLIAAGTDVNHINGVAFSLLHTAVKVDHADMIQLLLKHGATAAMNSVVPQQCVHECCTTATALMLCAEVDTVKMLLKAGADVHVTTDAGDTCLHVAVRHKIPMPVVCLLIKAGVDIHAVNHTGKTAAQMAHDKGYTLIEQILQRAVQQQESSSSCGTAPLAAA